MKRSGTLFVSLVLAGLLVSSCAFGPRPAATDLAKALVESSAEACVKQGPRSELCRAYLDLRLIQIWESRINEALPQFTITPLPCAADGPGCPWQEDYNRSLRDALEKVAGDPTPEPNYPIPFDVVPASIQLESATAQRQALAKAEADLDDLIEVLRAGRR